jgi:hypothetical protein
LFCDKDLPNVFSKIGKNKANTNVHKKPINDDLEPVTESNSRRHLKTRQPSSSPSAKLKRLSKPRTDAKRDSLLHDTIEVSETQRMLKTLYDPRKSN